MFGDFALVENVLKDLELKLMDMLKIVLAETLALLCGFHGACLFGCCMAVSAHDVRC